MISFLKKCTPHNLFRKWPRLVVRKIKEKIRHTPLRMLIFRNEPVVLTDAWGVRFILYPWQTNVSLEKLISRRNYADEFSALQSLIQKNSCIIDAGAHIGIHATLMARWTGDGGVVYAFEPVESTYWRLCETIALNRAKNIVPIQCALSHKTGKIEMNLFDEQFSEWNSLGTPRFGEHTPRSTSTVPVTTLDEFCVRHGIERVHFLKADVEGFEKHLFEGARSLLQERRIDYISFEISQIPLKGAGITPREVFALLENMGYTIFQYNPNAKSFEGPVHDTDAFYTNFYATWKQILP